MSVGEQYKIFHNWIWKITVCPGTDVHPSVRRFQIQSSGHGSVPAKGLALTLSAKCAYLPACDLSNPSFRGLFSASFFRVRRKVIVVHRLLLWQPQNARERCQKQDWLDFPFFLFQLFIVIIFLKTRLFRYKALSLRLFGGFFSGINICLCL